MAGVRAATDLAFVPVSSSGVSAAIRKDQTRPPGRALRDIGQHPAISQCPATHEPVGCIASGTWVFVSRVFFEFLKFPDTNIAPGF